MANTNVSGINLTSGQIKATVILIIGLVAGQKVGAAMAYEDMATKEKVKAEVMMSLGYDYSDLKDKKKSGKD